MAEKPHILLVEDDPTQRLILSRMLERDYEVRRCDGYGDALRELGGAGYTPDLILSDMYLNDGNGMDLRRAVQNREALIGCPFIFLSGASDGKTKSDAALLGIDDFLEKPIRAETLLGTVERVLTRSRQIKKDIALRLDREITEPLHPEVPATIGHYNLHLSYQEMSAGGGDFVFHLEGPDGDYVLIGDVVGHGAPAKFFLHAYIGYLYGTVLAFKQHMHPASAADLLEILNCAVSENAFLKRWLFTCLALHIPYEGPMTLASAGHPAAWLCRRGGATSITLRGPMPGLMANIPYADATLRLEKGDRLILHTDGVRIDADLLRDSAALSTDEAEKKIMASAADGKDDATLLIIERGP